MFRYLGLILYLIVVVAICFGASVAETEKVDEV